MYEWIRETWNPLAGECPHNCEYCYVKTVIKRYPVLQKKYTGRIRFDEKTLHKKFRVGRVVFVASMHDLFADGVASPYIRRILKVTKEQEEGRTFLFQTKNPSRFKEFLDEFPKHSILATTIESNRNLIATNAPSPEERYKAMVDLRHSLEKDGLGFELMVTIEPILIFDEEVLVRWIKEIKPSFINVGADSKGHGLPEPTEIDIENFVKHLRSGGFEVLLKKNLRRIAPNFYKRELFREVENNDN